MFIGNLLKFVSIILLSLQKLYGAHDQEEVKNTIVYMFYNWQL